MNKVYRISKLRIIAQSRGLQNLGRKGYIETWKGGANQYEKLDIKFEAAKSKSPKIQAGSKRPRFAYRINKGTYKDPFTGKIGGPGDLSHIPLEPPMAPEKSAAVGAAAGALTGLK